MTQGLGRDTPTEALRRLDLTVRDVTSSPLGHLTGLDEPLDAYRSSSDGDLLLLDGSVDLARLARRRLAAGAVPAAATTRRRSPAPCCGCPPARGSTT